MNFIIEIWCIIHRCQRCITDVDGQINFQWGFRLGGWSLLLAGIILIISGAFEIAAKTEFYKLKTIEEPQREKIKKSESKTEEEKPSEKK